MRTAIGSISSLGEGVKYSGESKVSKVEELSSQIDKLIKERDDLYDEKYKQGKIRCDNILGESYENLNVVISELDSIKDQIHHRELNLALDKMREAKLWLEILIL